MGNITSARVALGNNKEFVLKKDEYDNIYLFDSPNGVPLAAGQLLGEKEYEVSTTDTNAQTVGTFTVNGIEKGDTLLFITEDTEGAKSGHFLKALQLAYIKGTGTNSTNFYILSYLGGVTYASVSSAGVYASTTSLAADGSGVLTITVSSKYNASGSRTIDGTYRIRVYKISY